MNDCMLLNVLLSGLFEENFPNVFLPMKAPKPVRFA